MVGSRVHTQLEPVSDKKLIRKYLLGRHVTEIAEFALSLPCKGVTLFEGVFFVVGPKNPFDLGLRRC